jgi:hypothetical protein
MASIAEAASADNGLLPHHFAQLATGSGISHELSAARGDRSIHRPGSYSEFNARGFNKLQYRLAPGLLIRVLDIEGRPVLYQFRPDKPRQSRDGKPITYETLVCLISPSHHVMYRSRLHLTWII